MKDEWIVIGFRKVDFDDPQKNRIFGYRLFLSRTPDDENIVGDECQAIFVSGTRVSYEPHVGDNLRIFYNKYGKVAEIAVV